MIRLIAADLDGTLLNNRGELPENLDLIISELNNKNIIFAAASGRLYGTLKRNFRHIPYKILFICHNGALIQFNNEEYPIFESIISPSLVSEAVDFLSSENVDTYLCDREFAYLYNPSRDLIREFVKCGVKTKEAKDLRNLDLNIYRIGVFHPDGIHHQLLEKLQQRFEGMLGFQLGGDVWLDIINVNIDKGTALRLVQEKFNIEAIETMVFGDYHNDIPMFCQAYYSYAMANSPETVKGLASFIASSNDTGGVIEVIASKILKSELHSASISRQSNSFSLKYTNLLS